MGTKIEGGGMGEACEFIDEGKEEAEWVSSMSLARAELLSSPCWSFQVEESLLFSMPCNSSSYSLNLLEQEC